MAYRKDHIIGFLMVVILLAGTLQAKDKAAKLVEPFFDSFPFKINYTIQSGGESWQYGDQYLVLKRADTSSDVSIENNYILLDSCFVFRGRSVFYTIPSTDIDTEVSLFVKPDKDTVKFYSNGSPLPPTDFHQHKYAPAFARYAELIPRYNLAEREYSDLMSEIYMEIGGCTILTGIGLWATSSEKTRDGGYVVLGIVAIGIIYDAIELFTKRDKINRYNRIKREIKSWTRETTEAILNNYIIDSSVTK